MQIGLVVLQLMQNFELAQKPPLEIGFHSIREKEQEFLDWMDSLLRSS